MESLEEEDDERYLSSLDRDVLLSVRPEGWEKLTLNRCNFSHFL